MFITVKENEYEIKFGINSFADTDLLDQTEVVRTRLFNGMNGEEKETTLEDTREFVKTLRSLVYLGCKKKNPLLNEDAAGDLIDDYLDENEENSVVGLFVLIINELMTQGFIARLTPNMEEDVQAENNKTNKTSATTKRVKKN